MTIQRIKEIALDRMIFSQVKLSSDNTFVLTVERIREVRKYDKGRN